MKKMGHSYVRAEHVVNTFISQTVLPEPGVQIMKLLITHFPLVAFYLSSLTPKYVPQHPTPEHP
jgi:hypothetical protein